MQADGGLCLQFDAPRRCRAGPTIGSGARAGQSKQADASTSSTAIWAQVNLQSSLLFVGRLGIGFSVFQLVFQAKIQTEIKPINQYINQSIQLTPAHQAQRRRRPRASFLCLNFGSCGRKIGFSPFLVGRFPKILPAPVFRCTREMRSLVSTCRWHSTTGFSRPISSDNTAVQFRAIGIGALWRLCVGHLRVRRVPDVPVG